MYILHFIKFSDVVVHNSVRWATTVIQACHFAECTMSALLKWFRFLVVMQNDNFGRWQLSFKHLSIVILDNRKLNSDKDIFFLSAERFTNS